MKCSVLFLENGACACPAVPGLRQLLPTIVLVAQSDFSLLAMAKGWNLIAWSFKKDDPPVWMASFHEKYSWDAIPIQFTRLVCFVRSFGTSSFSLFLGSSLLQMLHLWDPQGMMIPENVLSQFLHVLHVNILRQLQIVLTYLGSSWILAIRSPIRYMMVTSTKWTSSAMRQYLCSEQELQHWIFYTQLATWLLHG